MIEYSAGFISTVAVTHGSVHIDSQIWIVIISLYGVINTTLKTLTEKKRMMSEAKEALSL